MRGLGAGMFLLCWNGKHAQVAGNTSWDELLAKASRILLDLELTPEVLLRFNSSPTQLLAMARPPKTWVELAVLQVVGEQDLVDERLREALDFHRSETDQTAAHVSLLADNTWRTPWMAAKLLALDSCVAQGAAVSLLKHLASTRPMNRTLFEGYMFDHLWENLTDFSQACPPVLLWHGQGKYEALFKFIAPRFLLAPDNVLDAERVHARWQWSCSLKRAVKMQSLNASLRLTHYLEQDQGFPTDEQLFEHLTAEGGGAPSEHAGPPSGGRDCPWVEVAFY